MLQSIAQFYRDGGIWMHPISICSIVAFSFAAERIISLFFRYNIDARRFWAQLEKLIADNNVERALKVCRFALPGAVPRVLQSALERANDGPERTARAVDESMNEVMRDVLKRTSLLPNFANIATLLGLLGTIIGLIEAFAAVASAPPDQKSAMLTQALAIGLNSTAYGLIVAIPTLALFVFLQAKTVAMVGDIEYAANAVQKALKARLERVNPALLHEAGGLGEHAAAPRLKRHPAEEGELNLNLNSMMDLFAVLIPALLMMSAAVELAILKVALPSLGGGGGGVAAEEKKALDLTVSVTDKGFIIAAAGGVLGAEGAAAEGARGPTIPLIEKSVLCSRYRETVPPPRSVNKSRPTCPSDQPLAEGRFLIYDIDSLSKKMKEIKDQYPDERRVIISYEGSVEYEAIIDTMDATRELKTASGYTPLFDEVLLSPGML